MTLHDLQKEAREKFDKEHDFLFKSDSAIVYSSRESIRKTIDSLISTAYLAGRNDAVEYIEEHIRLRGTYDMNYDDIYQQAKSL